MGQAVAIFGNEDSGIFTATKKDKKGKKKVSVNKATAKETVEEQDFVTENEAEGEDVEKMTETKDVKAEKAEKESGQFKMNKSGSTKSKKKSDGSGSVKKTVGKITESVKNSSVVSIFRKNFKEELDQDYRDLGVAIGDKKGKRKAILIEIKNAALRVFYFTALVCSLYLLFMLSVNFLPTVCIYVLLLLGISDLSLGTNMFLAAGIELFCVGWFFFGCMTIAKRLIKIYKWLVRKTLPESAIKRKDEIDKM